MLETLLGNELLRQSLQTALAAGRLAHSVLLCGEAGTGTGYAARCLAADYLYPQGGAGAQQVMKCENPELMVLQGEGASGEIKIDRVRAVRAALYSTAMSAAGRVVYLRGAHKLNQSSANALLKVIEEPPEGVLFVLTAPGEASVLPTIRSRCSIYTLSPVPVEACAAWLRKQYPGKHTDELAALFGGKVGTAVRCLTDPAAKKQLDTARALADAMQNADPYDAMVLLTAYEKDRAAARSLLDFCAQLCSACLRGAYPYLDAARAAACLPALAQANGALAGNGNAKLVFTVLAAQLGAPAG